MEDKRALRLVAKARRGDEDAFRELAELKLRSVLHIATNLMGNRADGEDAAQETFIVLAQNIRKLKKSESFDAWLYRIVYTVCMKAKKIQACTKESMADPEEALKAIPEKDAETLPEQKMEEQQEKERIMKAINKLPEHYRLCMFLYYYEQLSYTEIAKSIQVNEKVVANILVRARIKLREILGQGVQGETDEAPGCAVKAGAFLPAAAISSSIAFEGASMASSASFAKVQAAIADISIPKESALSNFLASMTGKAALAVLGVALVVAIGMMAVKPDEPHQNQPAAGVPAAGEQKAAAVQEPQPQKIVVEERTLTSSVLKQPAGGQASVVLQGDAAQYQAFLAIEPSLTFVKKGASDGLEYSVYRTETQGGRAYYVVVNAGSNPGNTPYYLDIEL